MVDISLETDFYQLINTYDIDDLEELFNSKGIIINKCNDGRIHFEVNLFDTSYKPYRIRYQSRGLVLDSIEKKFLAIPPNAFKYFNTVKESDVRKNFEDNKYRIIEANDGTNVTIYKFGGETYVSSSKSPDISNYYWQGDKTFSQMLYDVAIRTNPEFVKKTRFTLNEDSGISWNIPEKYSVTLGFRHHNIHPDKDDPERIWLVRCINRETLLDERLPALECLETNKDVTSEFATFDELLQRKDRDILLDKNDKNYGYILQSVSPVVDSIFIPSSLYRLYQHFFYSLEKDKNDKLKHNNRYIYSIMRNILSNNTTYLKVLSKIIPEYREIVDKLVIFVDLMVNRVISKVHDESLFADSIYENFINNIISEVVANEKDLDLKSPEATKLINDYVMSKDNTYELTSIYLNDSV